MKRTVQKEDNGSLMLDGMIAMLLTMVLLVFLMGFGFLLYQQWVVSSVADDTASRIAQSYAYPNTDPVIGYLNVDIIRSAPLFRYNISGNTQKNANKAEKYAAWSLNGSSLAYPVSEPEIQVREVYDGLARRHIEVAIQAEYEIPFGGALEYFGLKKTVTYRAVGSGVCVDILDYVNTVDTFKALTDQTFGSEALDAANSVLSMVHKIIELFE